MRTEEASDPKELENIPVRRKDLGPAPSPSSSASFPLSPTALGAPSLASPQGPSGLCHTWRGVIGRAGPRGELAAPALPDGTLV